MKKETEKIIILPVEAGLTCTPALPWEKAGLLPEAAVPLSGAENALVQKDIRSVVIFGSAGEGLCRRLAEKENLALLLMAEEKEYDRLCHALNPAGVLIIPENADVGWLEQGIFLLAAVSRRLRGLAARADDLQMKMDDMRLIERAKLLLVERLNMSEQQAHRYIEKRAMDRCVKRRTVAQEIIRVYES